MDDATATAALIDGGRRLGARGLISAAEGNLSVRLDAERLLVTPTGRRKDELGADDSSSSGSATTSGRPARRSGLAPTSDLAIHLAVHAARPDIGAVAHAHLPASMALTAGRRGAGPGGPARDRALLPRLPFVPFGEMGSDELADRIATRLRRTARSRSPAPSSSSATARTRSGRDRAHAVDRLELLEVLCRTWRDALLLRAARNGLDCG